MRRLRTLCERPKPPPAQSRTAGAWMASRALVIKRNVELLETLTQRERQGLSEVARCRVNKQIAFASAHGSFIEGFATL